MPIVVTEVFSVRDQDQLVDRKSLDRELFERMNAWVARWGLVVEQAGFTTIAPTASVLYTTQLRSRTMERARALRIFIQAGLDPGSALIMIGPERRPVARSSRRYHLARRRPGRTSGLRGRPKAPASSPPVVKSTEGAATGTSAAINTRLR
jgi:hypothetical protein